MKVRFDWQVVNDDDEWETIAQEGRRARRSRLGAVPRWVWYTALVVLVVGLLAGGLSVRRRYLAARQRISFQIQSVIDLEARAFAKGDEVLFLSQQDETARLWYAQQAQRASGACLPGSSVHEAQRDPCAPVLPAKLSNVELRGDVAWTEVIEGKPPVQRVRFYRQTAQGWKHTAPRESFWGDEVTLRADRFVARYHERDEPHVRLYLDRVQAAVDQACGALDCPSDNPLEIDFTIDPLPRAPYLVSAQQANDSDKLQPLSPWLSGLAMDGGAPDASLDRLVHWATYAIAARAVRVSIARDLYPYQEALLQEYAAWTSSQETAQAPILGRIIERHGVEALPDVLHSVSESRTLTVLLARWLSLSIREDQMAYLQTLLNIEREALLVGRRETFLLLQQQAYPWWMDDQSQLFDQWQRGDPALDLPAIRVRRVERVGGRARIEIQDPARLLEGYPPAAKSVVYLEYENGDWKHASPFAAAYFWAFLAERRPAGTVTPDRTPTPGPNL